MSITHIIPSKTPKIHRSKELFIKDIAFGTVFLRSVTQSICIFHCESNFQSWTKLSRVPIATRVEDSDRQE